MTGKDFRNIREELGFSREEFAEFLCLSSYNAVMNIEIDFRKPSKFTAKVLKYLDSLPKNKAIALIEEMNNHESQ